jgi:PIN domain nuclease of toxin-antitoxin system
VNYVLDACAMIAFLNDEDGADVVEGLLLKPANTCYAHAINLCEVFYDFHRAGGDGVGDAALRRLAEAGVVTRRISSMSFWRRAGRLKSQYVRVSLADCCCTALAELEGAEVVTSDHREFDALAAAAVCPVRFVR